MIIKTIQESCMHLFQIIWSIFKYHSYKFYSFRSEYSYIEKWFTDQNPKLLETEDKINILFS